MAGLVLNSDQTPKAPPWRIGLTGGIGSGKSTAATLLAAKGALILDADALGRELTGPGGEALPEIRATFGPAAMGPDGQMDRHWMRQRVFEDAQAKQQLEAILHPRIQSLMQSRALTATAPVIVFDIPLLTESSSVDRGLHEVWVVDASPQTQIRRVSARPGWTPALAQKVMAQQADRSERLAMADRILHNDEDDLLSLQHQIDVAWTALCGTM